MERREGGSRWEGWPWEMLLPLPGILFLFLPPAREVCPGLRGFGMERWPALERLSGLHKALEERRKGMTMPAMSMVTEDPHVTAANIYMLSHSAWWEDKETDVESSLSCPKSHSWKAKELPQTQVCQE